MCNWHYSLGIRTTNAELKASIEIIKDSSEKNSNKNGLTRNQDQNIAAGQKLHAHTRQGYETIMGTSEDEMTVKPIQ